MYYSSNNLTKRKNEIVCFIVCSANPSDSPQVWYEAIQKKGKIKEYVPLFILTILKFKPITLWTVFSLFVLFDSRAVTLIFY